jgi:uncharacterized heparinase superfamily protein
MMEGLRRAQRRLRSGPLYRWRPSGTVPANLAAKPPFFRQGDPAEANAIYSGTFTLDGESHTIAPGQTFSRQRSLPASDHWRQLLHCFGWLRHLSAAQTPVARSNATALMLDWIDIWENSFSPIVWRGDIASARLLAWLRYGDDLIVDGADAEIVEGTNRWRLRKSMMRHVRFLIHNTGTTRDGLPRLQARIGLATALACLGNRDRALHRASDVLDQELRRQILADGGHVSRNPAALVLLLDALITLRETQQKAGLRPSQVLVSTIARVVKALHFFKIGRLKDRAGLAQFNGTGLLDTAWISVLLRHEGPVKNIAEALPDSGYDRLDAGATTVLMDTGRCDRPALAPLATGGTLSFELASQNVVFISNCGTPLRSMAQYDPYARATAAHSTAVLADASSSAFHEGGLWTEKLLAAMPGALSEPPTSVNRARRQLEDGRISVIASHDGYLKRFGIRHERTLILDKAGEELDGSDRFPREGKNGEDCPVVIRFHIPPQIQASALSSGHSILLAGPNGEAWTFLCIDASFALEESIKFSDDPPRKTQQIAVRAVVPAGENAMEIRWAMRRKSASKGKRVKAKAAKHVENKQDLFALMDEPVAGDEQA